MILDRKVDLYINYKSLNLVFSLIYSWDIKVSQKYWISGQNKVILVEL